jgi:hypothetical protein
VKDLKTRLSNLLNIELDLIITENRSTMLNLLDKNKSYAKLSVHKMFLQAPDPVIAAIADYVRGKKSKHSKTLILREYIQSHLAAYDYTHLVNPNKLVAEGKVYHLRQIYEKLNQKYFNNSLAYSITWYGKPGLGRRRITFGQYFSGLRLIKIHRILDDSFFPEYFISFVVYHEMLHGVIPGGSDEKGRFSFHTKEFIEKEKAFEDYARAIAWEKLNKPRLFNYGWS